MFYTLYGSIGFMCKRSPDFFACKLIVIYAVAAPIVVPITLFLIGKFKPDLMLEKKKHKYPKK